MTLLSMPSWTNPQPLKEQAAVKKTLQKTMAAKTGMKAEDPSMDAKNGDGTLKSPVVAEELNRGGFNRKGRGGMNGRGRVYQRSGNGGDNSRYIPMKNMMQNVDGVQVLVDDNIRSKNDKGKSVAESEKKRWSEDLRKYYDDKCADKAKVNLVEGLKWRISKLQKDISYGHNNVAMFANTKANESFLTEEVRNTWTEEMNAKYEGMVSEKVDNMIKKHFDENMMECMNDEVAEETHGSVMFVTQDMASNVAGSSST
ncbi:hypothetical protein Tco_1042686 [Tanacetum coccineum]|uniref:Uncharacterized protein n=1 Tax=Tanacetum coccineum TaxID=301880 RepID=A0ABQ5GJU9_9ASTR